MTHSIKLLLFYSLFAISFSFLQAQNKATPPLDIPLKLSGTFGEFRATHFHAGLDIKTQGKEGFKVKSIKAGSVRRIKIATSGYGKCLYIQHPDGTTSVYAHLKKFAPKIESFIKLYQYEQETFEIQKFLPLGEMTIEQGEIIGYSGNTGGSLGPHLHFEIRDTKAETPLNPLQLGFDIPDSIRPIVQGLYRYKKKDNGLTEKTQLPLERINDSVYKADLQRLGGTHAFGIRLFDRQDLSYNRNGVYKATITVNGKEVFAYTFDKINFSDGKKIDALIDYSTYREELIRIQKLFRDLDVDYSFLPETAANGLIDFEAERAYQVQIIVEDYAHNKTYISFYVEGKINLIADAAPPMLNPITTEKDYLFAFDQHEVYVPKNTFYQTVDLILKAKEDTLVIEKTSSPQRKGFELTVAIPEALDSIEKQQLSLALYDPEEKKKEKQLRYVWTAKKDSILKTKYAYPGQYILTKDSLSPSIQPINFKDQQWMSNYKFLEVEIEDEFSGIKSYRATINGQWILMEYEPKDKNLIYNFADIDFEQTQLDFELTVEDQVGNQSVFNATIFRKQL